MVVGKLLGDMSRPLAYTGLVAVLVSSFTTQVVTNPYSILATLGRSDFASTNIESMALDPARLLPNVFLTLTVELSSTDYAPSTFQLTNTNGLDGFIVELLPPDGGWQIGSNHIRMSEAQFQYKGTPNWADQHRLELYLNKGNLNRDETITFSNVQFVTDGHPGVAVTQILYEICVWDLFCAVKELHRSTLGCAVLPGCTMADDLINDIWFSMEVAEVLKYMLMSVFF